MYNSIGCAIALMKCQNISHHQIIKIFAIVSAVMITLSTMFIKQHSFLDAVGASLLAVILYILIYKADIFQIEKRVSQE